MKRLFTYITLAITGVTAFAQGPYAPAAGQPETTAIHMDSSAFINWATGIEITRGWVNIADTTVYYNDTNLASFAYPSIALGTAIGTSYDAVSLGDGGVATLTFDRPIINGSGPDFAVFENGFGDTFLELAFVEVSSDGENFVRFPAISLTETSSQIGGFGALDATNLYNFAGKYRQGFGTPFDLEDIKDSANIDVNNIRFVRVIDVVGSIDPDYATFDSQGNIVNDPWPTPFNSCGFDLDAIGVINAGAPYLLSDINDLILADDSYWNGSDETGYFNSNIVRYFNDYNTAYGSWSGFSYSNMRDDTTAGYTNQFSAITRGGMNALDTGGTNYAVGFVPLDYSSGTYEPMPIKINFTDSAEHSLSGFYVTNATYAYLSMKNGDSFAKKFGGTSGNDPDYFKLSVWGMKSDSSITDTVEFYLADYRFADNTKDYIVKDWRWVDLSSLGAVKELKFSLMSSDAGDFGMNTPAYFCMDNLTISKFVPSLATNPLANISVRDTAANKIIDLNTVFNAGPYALNYQIVVNSDSTVSIATINGENLEIDFIAEGQSNLVISAEYNGTTVYDSMVVGVLPVIEGDFDIVDFEDLSLSANSYWNGSDESGNFTSSLAVFHNNYNSTYSSWNGWAYSNVNDVTTTGFMNQYAAYTGVGMDTAAAGTNYGISNTYGPSVISFVNDESHQVKGVYVTNSTYAALSMKHGDAFAKKFGGVDGNDEDYFKLSVWGKLNGSETDTVEFYLADYRFADNEKDYIIETWQWLDLSSLGNVDSLMFSLSSSDVGMWGMNTPAYFCMDNLTVITDTVATGINDNLFNNSLGIAAYPNPFNTQLFIETETGNTIQMYDIFGRKLLEQKATSNVVQLATGELKQGYYIIKISGNKGVQSIKVLKQ